MMVNFFLQVVGKKSNFAGFWGQIGGKIGRFRGNFMGNFGANFAKMQLVKKWLILWLFSR